MATITNKEILQFDRLVHQLTWSFHKQLSRCVDYDELFQIGREEVWKSLVLWTPEGGASKLTYVRQRVMWRFIWEMKRWQKNNRKVAAYSNDIDEMLGTFAEPHAMMLPKYQFPSLQPPLDELVDHVRTKQRFDAARAKLPPRLQLVLTRCLDDETLESIGADLGVTRERVRQLRNEALARVSGAVTLDVKVARCR